MADADDLKLTGRNNGESHANRILVELLRAGKVFVDELSSSLAVSPSTIRRALTIMEKQGLLRRIHGGAVPIEPALYEPFRHVSSFQEQEQQKTNEKRQIGLAAANLVADGDMIGIGAGTTTTQVARSIRHRKNITIVTNAINIAMELSHRSDLKVLLIGGELSGDWFALVGPTAIANIKELFLDKMFVGVDGISDKGLTSNYPDQAMIHRAMLAQARQKIVVADQQKIGKTGTALICPVSEINVFITNKTLPEAKLNFGKTNQLVIQQV